MKHIYILLLATCLATSLSATAQHKTVVYGNLGVDNVNISIVNTPYGTSTDAKGNYELPLFDLSNSVNLYYSCIGYQDTIVSLTPKQLQSDSVKVSFRMRKQDYSLQEVNVTAKHKLNGESHFFMDFEVFDDTIASWRHVQTKTYDASSWPTRIFKGLTPSPFRNISHLNL